MGVVVMGIVVQPGKVAIEQLKLKENIKHEPDDHDIDILRDLRIHLDSFGNKQQYFIPFFYIYIVVNVFGRTVFLKGQFNKCGSTSHIS